MILGDFNLVLDPLMDSDQYKHVNNPKSRNTLIQIMNVFNLVNSFRVTHPTGRRFTWRRKNPARQARLDYFLVSHALHDIITDCCINPSYRSNHSSIQMKLLINKFERGRGLWKFNCSLLKDKSYVEMINLIIQEEKQKYAIPVYSLDFLSKAPNDSIQLTLKDGQFLEILLMRIRGETIKFASFKKKMDLNIENQLKSEIKKFEENKDTAEHVLLEGKKCELEKLRESLIQGHVVRSRAQWLSEGEKPSKFFCSLEKHNYIEKTIKCIQLDNGTKLTDQKEILNEIRNFYSSLFSQQTPLSVAHLESILGKYNIRKLTQAESDTLEGDLNLQEISFALKNMKNNKCPGVDGFPAEFFKFFWGHLKYFVVRALNSSYYSGLMSTSMRTCIINCLPKGDKSREFMKNWRPISLLSVMYKLASSAIANRLKTVLEVLICKAQTGFLKGRFIGDSTRLVYDIMHHLEHNNLSGQLMLVDFQKAFDSVSWAFLMAILKYLNFGDSFRKWISVFNNNIKAHVLQS